MRQLILVPVLFALCAVPSLVQTAMFAQNSITAAKPEESARMKPLIAELTKAQEALLAKQVQLPEAKAVNDAKAVYDKAVLALNDAAKKLPEHDAAKQAEAKALEVAYEILASHQLSSLKYKPEMNPKGELVFTKIPPKP